MNGTLLVLLILAAIFGIAGTLGVAYAILRSSSDKERREIDKQLIESQRALIAQNESELARQRHRADEMERKAIDYRNDLTQKAAVDHLLEVLIREEQQRHEEHERQDTEQRQRADENVKLLKEIIAKVEEKRRDG